LILIYFKIFILVYHDELCEKEKSYIIEWVEEYKIQNPFDKIRWKNLISEMKNKFGKLRTENCVKNFWSLKQRQQRRSQLPSKDDALSSSQDDIVPTVSPLPQHNNVLKSASSYPQVPQNNNFPKSVLFPQR
jgi:hypothetical protein